MIAAHPIAEELYFCVRHARPPRLRTMRQFAEQEIVIPDGPYKDLRFRVDRQPYTGLFFDAVDSGRYSEIVATGPVQSGKTFCAYVIPLLYHLFEIVETVILGLPDMNMAGDKWRQDILPVIAASRYAELLPTSGAGSRGAGKVEYVDFRNGTTLKFMSGGGDDKKRAAFTSRVVVITETDALDVTGGKSEETTKVGQIEARTKAFDERATIYKECTITIKEGHTHRRYSAGTASRIAIRCTHCRGFVSPEREHFVGYENAEHELAAGENSFFFCPACGEKWTDADRAAANQDARLVHRGQEITPEGKVVGPHPPTRTLGFRWSAVNNLFASSAQIGREEWSAARDENEEEAERKMCQFTWAVPYQPPVFEVVKLDPDELAQRVLDRSPRGQIPADTDALTVGVDLGKWWIWYLAVAWRLDGTCHVPEYGKVKVTGHDQMGTEAAVLAALQGLRNVFETGWTLESGGEFVPDQVWIDCSWEPEIAYTFARECDAGTYVATYRPAMGYGARQEHHRWYRQPQSTSKHVKHLGSNYHISYNRAHRVHVVHVNADVWKSWAHERLATPLGKPGSLSIFQGLANEHRTLARHWTAERQVTEFIPGRGDVTTWKTIRRDNHWFDNFYTASAAGHLCDFRIIEADEPPAPSGPAPPEPNRFETPSGGFIARREDYQ